MLDGVLQDISKYIFIYYHFIMCIIYSYSNTPTTEIHYPIKINEILFNFTVEYISLY